MDKIGLNMINLNLSKNGADLIKYFEGYRLNAYPDPGTGGAPWTIGYGHTGPEVVKGLKITKAQADAYFEKDVARFVAAVNKAVKVEISQGLFDSLVSFCYNVGVANFNKFTLLKLVNQRKDSNTISNQFRRYVYAAGRKLPGLVKRREAEVLQANGLPWRTASSSVVKAEILEMSNVTVEPTWTRKETDNLILNPTNIGSAFAGVGAIISSFLSTAGDAANQLKVTAGELGAYTAYVPEVKYVITALMVVSLGLVIYNKVRKVIESRR